MKIFIFLAFVCFVAADEKYYSLEKIDLSKIGDNIGVLKNFMDCLLEKGPCSDVYESYRVRVSESLRSACGKCTPELKLFAAQFFELLKQHLPQEFEDFLNKYDPERKYYDNFMDEINKNKV